MQGYKPAHKAANTDVCEKNESLRSHCSPLLETNVLACGNVLLNAEKQKSLEHWFLHFYFSP